MSLKELKYKMQLSSKKMSPIFGTVSKISTTSLTVNGLNSSIGDIVKIVKQDGEEVYGMVTQVEKDGFLVTPFSFLEGHKIGDMVYIDNRGLNIPISDAMLGRVVDPFGLPIDGKGDIVPTSYIPVIKPPISAMKRGVIKEKFSVGVKSVDGLLTCGKGQKLGIFAGSGVGKSTLMGMMVRGSEAPIKVVALIGERGREVPEFIEKNLGGDLTNTILVVATSDDSPLMRKYGAFAAMSIAEYFKNKNQDVLFMMDSVTRFAMAQREIGLAMGEPPTSKGYPPSVFTLLPQLMERAGKEDGKGSITAFFTILVEGDDMNDPIADQSRSILDGHIVLNRALTDLGLYPPVDILSSASRLMNDVVEKDHILAARKFRRMYSLLKENEALIRIGAYAKGSDKELDEAIIKKDIMNQFLSQDIDESISLNESLSRLKEISV